MRYRHIVLCIIAAMFALAVWQDGENTPRNAQAKRQAASTSKGVTVDAGVPESKGSGVKVTKNEPARATKTMTVIVTAYCEVPSWSKWTAAERIGTCATDWNVIPPGSIVHVAGRHLTAMGRHGQRGRVVDVFLTSRHACRRFGRRVEAVRVEF